MKTQRKGDIALARGIADFTEAEAEVSLPITESAPYDLIVDFNGQLHKVQVKYWGNTKKSLDLRRVFSNSKGYQTSRYQEGDYHWLYVYSPEKGSFLLKRCLTQTAITPQESDKFSL